ncbi:uncharacterized protein LOC116435129 [Nomia melanderi]|uniref:uncharacterized protein LOC116435129 n=1 Tax=Nomia melanderi TaxID=2448451 RepID=UPI001304024F|nr:uncharacterized protein LOC116435129 [Nomia melanderi]
MNTKVQLIDTDTYIRDGNEPLPVHCVKSILRAITVELEHRKMYLSATVLAMILVSCHAFAPGDLESLAADEAEPYALTVDLKKFLESMKETLKKGDTRLNIPVLDPLKQDHLDVNLKEKIVELEATLDNLRVHHLSDYTVNKGELKMIGFKVSVDLMWNEIDLMTLYKVTHGKLIDALSFYGEGSIAAVIKNLQISVDIGLSANKEGFLFVRELDLGVRLGGFDFSISGLYNDDEVSKILSQIISELVPEIVQDYSEKVSDYGGELVTRLLNQVLSKITIDQLLEMIRGK